MKRNSKGAFQVSTAPGPGRRRLVLLLQLQLNLKSASVREEHMVWRRMWCEWARARQEERGRRYPCVTQLDHAFYTRLGKKTGWPEK